MPEVKDPATTRRATALIAMLFILSFLASAGLVVVYVLGGQPQAEGALLAVALGGIGFGIVLWVKHLIGGAQAVEARHELASSPEEREAFAKDFVRGEDAVRRRSFLAKLLTAAVAGLAAVAVFPIRSLGPRPGRSLLVTPWAPGRRLVDEDGRPLRAEALEVGSFVTVFPEGHIGAADAQTVLIRLRPGQLPPRPGREDWSPEGFVAYSKVCTHAGCPVGLYEQETNSLFCPCHQSAFDVLDGAKPVTGPATRPLPQLPLAIDADGYLVATSDFPEPVGPGFWGST